MEGLAAGAWKCHAQPARLGGKPCGHINSSPTIAYPGGTPMEVCAGCGCTKYASDLREAKNAATQAA